MSTFSGTIVTLGGGGFSTLGAHSAIDDHILALTGRAMPRVCFVPTASGDDRGYVSRFAEAFAGRADTSVCSLFCRSDDPSWFLDPRRLLEQDVIYVGGGSTANLLTVWRVHGLPDVLRQAAAGGTVLAGISAGMNCWFEASSTDSFGPLAPLDDGLGFLPGSACPHLFGEVGRAEKFTSWIADGALPDGHAADEHVALIWRDGRLSEVVAERHHRQAWRVERHDDDARVMPLPVHVLPDVEPPTVADRISRILYDADPLGISGGGSDEYDAEAKAIAEAAYDL